MTILDMERVVHEVGTFGEELTPTGGVELVKGKFGQACRFRFVEEARGGYFRASIRATPEWDRAAGISFWVKGDGSPAWGGLELVDAENPRLRYQCEFPLDSTRWRKVSVPWCDFLPFVPEAPSIGPDGYHPSRFGGLNFGNQAWYFEYPACSFAIDEIRLEPEIAVDRTDYTPAGEPLARVRQKLAKRRPLSIVTLGDSLTSRYHWANKETCWVDRLAWKLRVHVHSEVAVIDPCMGGHQLTHGLLQMGRWLPRCPHPDLITIWFGGNDWSDGMRRARFEEVLRFALDRIRRLTQGSADLLLMTAIPWLDTWGSEIHELGAAARTVAVEKKAGLCDTYAAFRRAGQDPTIREALYAWDKVHLGEYGHEVAAGAVKEAIVGG